MKKVLRLIQSRVRRFRFSHQIAPGCHPDVRELSDHMKRDIGWYNRSAAHTTRDGLPIVVRDYVLRHQM